MLKTFLFCFLNSSQTGTKKRTKETSESPLFAGIYAALHARVGEEILECSYWRGAYERERVANYLELPNNLMTFLQKSHSFFEP